MGHGSRHRQMLWCVGVMAVLIMAGAEVWLGIDRGAAQTTANRPSLRKVAEFELPGPPGKRFDYLTIAEDDKYLLSAAPAAAHLHRTHLRANSIVQHVED